MTVAIVQSRGPGWMFTVTGLEEDAYFPVHPGPRRFPIIGPGA
jgi:hypothetical protein